MNKIGFLLSGLLTFLGLITIGITSFTTKLLPKIGWMVFKLSGPSSYNGSNYSITFTTLNSIAIFEIIIGLVLCIFFYWRSTKAD